MKKFLKSRKESLLLALVASSFLNAGCSTPTVPDDSSDRTYETAMSSYEVCSQRLYPTSGNNYCNSISSRYGGMSYNQYVYGNPYSSGYKAELESTVSTELLNEAWKSYLRSLDAETLKDLAAQWDELAAAEAEKQKLN